MKMLLQIRYVCKSIFVFENLFLCLVLSNLFKHFSFLCFVLHFIFNGLYYLL